MINSNESEMDSRSSPVEILRSWGVVDEQNLESTIQMLRASNTVESLRDALVAEKSGAGIQQFLIPLFQKIYPNMRTEILPLGESYGFSADQIDQYFLGSGASASFAFSLKNPQFPKDKLTSFTTTVNELMISKLKDFFKLR